MRETSAGRRNASAAGSPSHRGASARTGRSSRGGQSSRAGQSRKHGKRPKKVQSKKVILAKLIGTLVAMFVLAIGIFFGSGLGGTIVKLHKEAVSLVRSSSEETFRASETSVTYDVKGDQLSTLKGEKDVYYMNFEEIPEFVKDAFISIEDKKFYEHGGFDAKAILRAALAYVKNGRITQGGSTITQQLSRNVFLSHHVSWERKAEEIFISMELEKKYSKDDILEFYINNIYFANGYYGIEAASRGYFNRGVNDLTLSQIAFLCAIPNSPTRYDPMEHKEATLKRRDRILVNMRDDGKITGKQYEEAIGEEITLDVPVKEQQNYVETFVYYCATREIMKMDGFVFQYAFSSDREREEYEDRYNQAYTAAQKILYSNGYQIYTSINLDVQQQLQIAVDEQLEEFTKVGEDGTLLFQAAATCVDNSNGLVCAIVGGRSQSFTGYTLNRAYQSFRQPGSSIKPLLVYTPCLERDYTPKSKVNDEKIEDGPSNSDGSYSGRISLRRAVAKSKNTVAWSLFKELTPKVGLKYLTNMEFSKIQDGDNNLAAALGGFTKGASTVEMAGGYATLANGGMYRQATCILRILDSEGNLLVNNENRSGVRVYEEDAAYMMTDMLQTVIEEGTGKGLGLGEMPCAGKTGTTNDNKDGWFVGFTPYYTTSVWVGYDMPKKVPGLYGSSYPGEIWHQFMKAIHVGYEPKEFAKAEGSGSDHAAAEPVTPSAVDVSGDAVSGPSATVEPSHAPTATGTPAPTQAPATEAPTEAPAATEAPTEAPVATEAPTQAPTEAPTEAPVATNPPEEGAA